MRTATVDLLPRFATAEPDRLGTLFGAPESSRDGDLPGGPRHAGPAGNAQQHRPGRPEQGQPDRDSQLPDRGRVTTATSANLTTAIGPGPTVRRRVTGVNLRAGGGRSGLLMLAALLPATAALAEISNGSLLGAGLRSRPAYDGSATQQVEAVPVIRYLGPTWFARSTQGVLEAGARSEVAAGLRAGVQVAYEPGRQTGGVPFLESHRVDDVGRGVSIGLHVEWDHSFGPMPVTLLARVRKHTAADRGLQADLRLSAGLFKGGRFGAGAFVQSTWADARAANALYGTGSQAAALTDLPGFAANGGWLSAGAGVLWSVDLGPAWVVVGSIEARRLQGSAARSPFAEQRTNGYVSAGLARQF